MRRRRQDWMNVEVPVSDNLAPAKTLCLLNENAQCNPIWASQPDGLKLVHFQTFQQQLTRTEHAPLDAAYEKCERICLPESHL